MENGTILLQKRSDVQDKSHLCLDTSLVCVCVLLWSIMVKITFRKLEPRYK